MYDPILVEPMRKELTSIGVQELRTPEEVDKVLKQNGTTLIVVNSVCGCAAGNARPGVKLALTHNKLPNRITTVFAGVDKEATVRARYYMSEYPSSSPCIALFKNAKPVFVLPRALIEGRSPQDISKNLIQAFDKHV